MSQNIGFVGIARRVSEGDRIETPDGLIGSFENIDESSGTVCVSLGLRVVGYNPEVLKKAKPD